MMLLTLLILAADPMPAPPMVSLEEASCAPCASGAQCIAGKCQFACQTSSDCERGLICTEARVCEPRLRQLPGQPPTIRRGDATHPERFRFSKVVPEGFHVASEANYSLLIGGSVTFGVSYLTFAMLGTALGSPENLIPFIGPIMAYRESYGWFSGLANFVSVVAITADVIGQVAGVVMFIAGLNSPRRWLERDVPAASTPSISFSPTAPGADLGASVVGRF